MQHATAQNVSSALADFAADLRFEDLPADVVEQARLALLDVFGIALAGHRVGEGWREIAAYAATQGSGPAAVWATGECLPAGQAALVNAVHARTLDFDDIIDYPQIHVTVCLAPAAIAMAQAHPGPDIGRRLLTAMVAGAEIQTRLAAAIAPHFGSGLPVMLGSQLFGYFSAAAACGSVLGFDRQQMRNALGLAQMLAAGTEEMVVHAAQSAGKVLYAGLCNQGGVQAASMALAGVQADGDPIGGRAGLLQACFPNAHDLTRLTEGLGETFLCRRRCLKAQPGTLVSHAFVEAARNLRERHRLRPDDIFEVHLEVGPWGLVMCEPHTTRRAPPSASAAMNSIPYAVACALAHGDVRVADFAASGRADPATLAMAARIGHQLNPALARPGGVEPGILSLRTKTGLLHSEHVDVALGQPSRPMSFDDVVEKFRRNAACAEPHLPDHAVDAIVEAVRHLDALDDLDALLKLLSA